MAELPILQFEEKIIETVERNSVVVIIGETGSGKSTQLSQILHRRGYTNSGVVGVTQPRRVAAVSVARRVSQELNVRLGEEVGYAIRFEDRTSERTRIKYLTDGVLLRESLSNPELDQYSVIILDEAHERSLNTDILLGLMKRLVKRRASNLKVLITSATLDGDKVSQFFSNCPVLNVPGKLYPVEILYSNERPKSYLESSLKTALDIHIKEPKGDVLIFMTGQDDIEKLVSKLEDRVRSLEEGSVLDAIILPLHGSLQPEMQVRVFSPPPPNCRRFIVATNIAETSLTVDGVVYVIDSGYVKQRQYNPSTGMYSLEVVQISKVQANQRAGRAGRTRPGKCYRLYPSVAYHEELLDATIPEIQRSSLAGSVLYLKSLDLPDIDILTFDFLDSPSSESLRDALNPLYLIDAIDENGLITRVGKTMAGFGEKIWFWLGAIVTTSHIKFLMIHKSVCIARMMGCCSCFGFSIARKPKPKRKPSYSYSNHPSQEHLLDDDLEDDDDCSYNDDATSMGNAEESEQQSRAKRPDEILSFREQNGMICRQYPVKETHKVVRTEDDDGNKMVNEYVRECKIGSGSYGKVVLYRSLVDGKHYALKAFHKSHLLKLRVAPSETAMTDVLREVLIMKMLEHPNIVNLIEVIDDPDADHFYMVLEYVEGKWVCEGSGPPGGLGESTARKYLRDIVRGLMYLHDHNIVHGDIKPDNLLVSSNGTVKIGDFSVSQVFEDDNDELRRSPGTPVFTAPECCLGLTYHGKAADTWAVGVTLYCMVLGQYPFLGDTLQDTYDKIVNNPLVLPENMTPQLKNLLEGLLCKDPAMRMTLEEVADHSWVVGNDGRMPHYLCWCKRRRKSLSIREESNGTKDDCSITHTD